MLMLAVAVKMLFYLHICPNIPLDFYYQVSFQLMISEEVVKC